MDNLSLYGELSITYFDVRQWLFAVSMWMLFGLYGSQQLEMGMFYSRVVKANSFFVKEIKVRALVSICVK